MKNNIALIGFMGTGKTSVGLKLANILGWKFVDTDQIIEERLKMTINEIFKILGEKVFRIEEKRVVKELVSRKEQVISTGGGVILDKENIAFLKQSCIIVCLEAKTSVLYQRIGKDINRPLLKTKNLEDLVTLRKPYYQCADIYIDTSDSSVENVAKKIINELKKWGINDEN